MAGGICYCHAQPKAIGRFGGPGFLPRQDSQLKIQLGSGCIRRFRDRLYYVTNSPQPEDITEVNVAELTAHSQPLAIMSGKGCRAPYDYEQVSVRFGRLQDKIKPCTKLALTPLSTG